MKRFIINLFNLQSVYKLSSIPVDFPAKTIFLDKMFYFVFTVALLRLPCIAGLKRSRFQLGDLSYAYFVPHKFQHLQGSLLDSSCEVGDNFECAFVCINKPHCVSFNIALLPNENGKFRCELLNEDMFKSPDNLTASQQFHHYSIKVCSL